MPTWDARYVPAISRRRHLGVENTMRADSRQISHEELREQHGRLAFNSRPPDRHLDEAIHELIVEGESLTQSLLGFGSANEAEQRGA